ncbi:MAG: tRNA (adenosine(37)-N6)-dimethylallyltransferase MiaA [Bacteroidales bacterium]|jgi:tRNA dimethylallyltransferase|nr:tRNA (adenosine(37)-N6)-dimethylallyltransferase MiaA [Bacteroidales bacterium]MDD3131326.1 tRNA (adenosine(37)-N6)-dimethylallyltransferase MiaA [Bacteroidales bacterium]MDY0335677.1 tRNA (adenosine(37)-N6)-dimethylallyltransferase MiaA [Bacteroidales bacterium]NLO52666.1 tRNA (adenosine(37)-N6)-dimethylallyltransferase MiaA [Bacteroidales bacterium]
MATENQTPPLMITILGATATGKTKLATRVADKLQGEIISADSRQVYRGMNLGTGKDYDDYAVDDKKIPYHLIDIVEAGTEYNVFEFQCDFLRVFDDIVQRKKLPVMCGGTGLYLEAVLQGYLLDDVPRNQKLRNELDKKSLKELVTVLETYRETHNTTDSTDRDRAIRAIEIAKYRHDNNSEDVVFPPIRHSVFGINMERNQLRQRITERLSHRLNDGMIDEVKELMESGLTADQLSFYGLEYRHITDYITGETNYNEMFKQLNTAIHQYAKRQITWFRRMEKKGITIIWIEGSLSLDDKLGVVINATKDYL